MYKKSTKGILKHIDFVLLDLVCLELAYIVAFFLRHATVPFGSLTYRIMGILFIFVDIAVLMFTSTFKNVLKRSVKYEIIETVKHSALVILFAVLYLFVVKEEDFSRFTMVATGVIYTCISFATRMLWKYFLVNRSIKANSRTMLVVTTSDVVERVMKTFKTQNLERIRIVGIVIADKDMTGERIDGIPVVCAVDDSAEYICREWVDEVFVIFPPNSVYPMELIDQYLETGITVHMNLAKVNVVKGKEQVVEKLNAYTVLTTSINSTPSWQLFLKRLMDIAGGIVGCFITGLLIVTLGPIIYINSPGPIFFTQERVGKNGKKFKMYKFRSMDLGAEKAKIDLLDQNIVKDGMMFKMDFDPRIIGNRFVDGKKKTGIGEFIRKTSLDEFPQFLNVLKGEMSLVGTRPPTVDEYEKYKLHHRARLSTKPGITGMWQVNGRSKITDFEKVVALDMEYISNWSIGMDIKIILKTIATILTRDDTM